VRLILAAGTTSTAGIEGISAAGADPELMVHTPAADAEILAYGDVVRAPAVPASPTGCPTPAVVTRAVREVVGFDATVVDAGLAVDTAAPTVSVGARAGRDLREPTAVPDPGDVWTASREFGRALPDGKLLLAETVPGGTTTAMGVLRALGETASVSSSLPTNPIARKRSAVAEGLAASGLEPGDLAGESVEAVRRVGDPVQAVVAGVAEGATEAGTEVVLAGGTQMLAVAALLEHAGLEAPVRIATTSFVADDPGVDLEAAVAKRDLPVDLTVTDPGFTADDHPAMARYVAGEAKEGVGMGGALWLADRTGRLPAVRDRIRSIADRLDVEPSDAETDELADDAGNEERGSEAEPSGTTTEADPDAEPLDITREENRGS